jgi:hypothetical protein
MCVIVTSPCVEATEDMYEYSDLPAAACEAGAVIERKGLWFEGHCIENKISYIGFDTSTPPMFRGRQRVLWKKKRRREVSGSLRDLILRDVSIKCSK